MSAIGRIISPGTLQAYHKGTIRSVVLDEFRGRWLILLFYPGDFTFVCPTEPAEVARLYPAFRKLGAEVCGVSTDSVYVHGAWHDSSPMIRSVEFPLIADTTTALSREFGMYLEEEGVALRGTFLIDPDGVCGPMRCMITVSGGMPEKCCASFRRPYGCEKAGGTYALQAGSRGSRRSPPALTSWESYKMNLRRTGPHPA